MVDADIDMVFRSGDAHNRLRPVGFSTNVINIGPYRRFEFLPVIALALRQSVRSSPRSILDLSA
jgi:hypothetical protein